MSRGKSRPRRKGFKVMGGVRVGASARYFRDSGKKLKDYVAVILKLPPPVRDMEAPKDAVEVPLARRGNPFPITNQAYYVDKEGRIELLIFLPRFSFGPGVPPTLPGMPPM